MAEATHCHQCGGWIRDGRITLPRAITGDLVFCRLDLAGWRLEIDLSDGDLVLVSLRGWASKGPLVAQPHLRDVVGGGRLRVTLEPVHEEVPHAGDTDRG